MTTLGPVIADIYSIPDIYDILHAGGTAREVLRCERIVREYAAGSVRTSAAGPASKRMRWIEPACGTGRYVRALAVRGHHAVGLDTSQPMIDYARSRAEVRLKRSGGKAEFVIADMTETDKAVGTSNFDAALNLINSIRHLPSDGALGKHLKSTAAALKPGGVYIVGLSTAMYGHESPTEDVWKATRGRTTVTQVVQYEPPAAKRGAAARVERAYSHITVTSPTGSREYVSSYSLRTYSRRQWLDAIDASPFQLAAVVDERVREIDVPELGYGIYVLRKPV